MSAKSSGGGSDDPMDLGPFLENYVMNNPFRGQQQQQQATRAVSDGRAGGRTAGMTLRCRSAAQNGQIPRLTGAVHRRWRPDDASNDDDDDRLSSQSAEMLLHNSEDSNHADVTVWLHENYRYLAGRHRLLVATQHLQLRVQQVFPHVAADTVDVLVLQTFPCCVKISNKNGLSFYQGLVARPDPEMYENPPFREALDSITNRALTTRQAAAEYGVRESALLAAVSWSDVEPQPAVATERSESGRSDARRKRQRVTDSEQSSADEPRSQRLRSSVDDAVDFELMLQEVTGSGARLNTDCSVSRSSSENDIRPSVPQRLVSVKSEPNCSPELPSTVTDSQTQPINFCLSSNPQSVPNALNVTQSCVSSPASSALAALPANCKDVNSTRQRSELEEALSTNLALQEELSGRDFHLAQLAEDFFCLHEQFKQLARHFQAVLGDIQPHTADQSGINQVMNNHNS